jgi:kynureninase
MVINLVAAIKMFAVVPLRPMIAENKFGDAVTKLWHLVPPLDTAPQWAFLFLGLLFLANVLLLVVVWNWQKWGIYGLVVIPLMQAWVMSQSGFRTEDILDLIDKNAEDLAVVIMGAVNFFTGQLMDIEKITAAAQKHGIVVGFDLAHATGNVPLSLHEWNIDFAVWCSYKYLNAGPGAVAGAFVHERHATNTKLPRFAGWFGNDPNTRFRLHLEPEFVPVASADGWQISNPPIFSMAPLRTSLSIFHEAGGMEPLRAKSMKLTGYLEFLIEQIGSKKFSIITPADPNARGAQLSIQAHEHPKQLHEEFIARGVKCDFREPNVIRVAPAPLYNTFHEVWRFAQILAAHK